LWRINHAVSSAALFDPDDPAALQIDDQGDVFACASQIELVNGDGANLAVTDAPVILFQPSLHHGSDRVQLKESQPAISARVMNRATIYDQSRERTRDFRLGFDKGGSCSNSSPVVVFNHRGTLTLSTTGLSPMDTLRTARQR
jgi:hypothetical protein